SSCLSLDSLGGVHVVWTRPSSGYIFYAWKPDGGDWSFDTVSTSGSHPFVDFHGDFVHVVWQDDNKVYHVRRWLYGDWEEIEEAGYGAKPQISGGYVIGADGLLYQWTYGDGWTFTGDIYPSSRLCGDSVFWVLYSKGDELRLSSLVIEPPWFFTDDSLSTFGNNQRKVAYKDGRIELVFTGYGHVFYRYHEGYWSEPIDLGKGILPCISMGDYTSVVYLTPDSFPVHVWMDGGIKDTVFGFKVTSPPSCVVKADTVYLAVSRSDSIRVLRYCRGDFIDEWGLRFAGSQGMGYPSLGVDMEGRVHVAFFATGRLQQDSRPGRIPLVPQVYYGLYGSSPEVIASGLHPSLYAGDMVEVTWEDNLSRIYRMLIALDGEKYPSQEVGDGVYPVAGEFVNFSSEGIRYWDGVNWNVIYSDLLYPAGTIHRQGFYYRLYAVGYRDGRVVWLDTLLSVPSRIPVLYTDTPFSTAYSNARRVISVGDTLYLAYVSSGEVYLTFSLDHGRHWGVPVRVGEGMAPALGSDGERLYVAWFREESSVPDMKTCWIYLGAYSRYLEPLWSDTVREGHLILFPPPVTGVVLGVPSLAVGESVYVAIERKRIVSSPELSYTHAYLEVGVFSPDGEGRWMVLDSLSRTGGDITTPLSPSIDVYPKGFVVAWDPWGEEVRVYDRDNLLGSYPGSEPHVECSGPVAFLNTKVVSVLDGKVQVGYPLSPYPVGEGNSPLALPRFTVYERDGDIYWIRDALVVEEDSIVTSLPSHYPQAVLCGDTLVLVWTEGDEEYRIMTARVPVNPGRLVYLDNLGFDVPSFFNVYRDTFFIFGDEFYESMDAGFDSLVYEFPLLSSGREYTLRLYFYNPWDRKLKLRLEVDGSSRGNA
ncbi:hypothetical protein DRQ20_07460, partial [bacterium]